MATEFTFVSEGHQYFNARGVRVLSVTQILNNVGLVNYDGIPQETLDHKAAIGTAAHAACHYFDESDLDMETLDPEVLPYVQAWERFRSETDFVPELIEHRGIATIDGIEYGFTLDRIGQFNGHPTLIEIKCTAGVEVSWGSQCAAYALAMKAEYPKLFRLAVHLKPNATYSLVPLNDIRDYQIFRSALAIETYKHTVGRKNGNGSRFTR